MDYLDDVETVEEYDGYYYSVPDALGIVILGLLCGFKNVRQIHQWATNGRTRAFLRAEFGIERIPCYYWLLTLLAMARPESLGECFTRWVESILPGRGGARTVALDGKSVRSSLRRPSPLHVVSALVAESGLTLAQEAVGDRSNEIPAVRRLVALLDLEGCVVTADAMHCQRDTARAVRAGGADYLLCAKENQRALRDGIRDYVRDGALRRGMARADTVEKGHGRVEERTAFVSHDVSWMPQRGEWRDLACFGAVRSRRTVGGETGEEWRYYISSRRMGADEFLSRVRLEWSVESMHWLLDVHYGEDGSRILDRTAQRNLNILRKSALNCIRVYRDGSKTRKPLSGIMLDCLLDNDVLVAVLGKN